MTETTRRILEALDAADSGRLRIAGLAAPPYREDALLEAGNAYRRHCRISGRSDQNECSIEVEVLPAPGVDGRDAILGFLNHFLEVSIRNYFRCR